MMSRILYIPNEFEYDHLQRVKLKVIYSFNRCTANKEYEFSVEQHRTTYLFLLQLIVMKTKINAQYFTVKLNGWSEICNLREKIPDRRIISIYFIINNRYN